MKTTKGPWTYESGSRDVIVAERGYNDVLIAQLYKIGQNHEANGLAIAAVPDMLAALETALEDLNTIIDHRDIWTPQGIMDHCHYAQRNIVAALAKARGEA